jgi:hypothetical protein
MLSDELEANQAPSPLPIPPTGTTNHAVKHELVIREGGQWRYMVRLGEVMRASQAIKGGGSGQQRQRKHAYN